ncbi:hypothetical protein TIFTF001_041686 [Ficus carica]|uniref:Uncharacterized protein n=1 Tax=Ficus carica TaxID=3494 RepID=A0AA88CUE1_FICCA|nr:hypothetical protein TIFTF001_041686 [Ficus carica]
MLRNFSNSPFKSSYYATARIPKISDTTVGIWAFRGLGCSGRPDRVGYGITQQGQPLPGQVAAGGDVTRCRSGQAEPAVDGTCVRKGVAGGARAPRALSLWNALPLECTGARGLVWYSGRLAGSHGQTGHSGPLASGIHWCEGARLVFWSAIRLTRVDGALRALSLWNALGARLVFWSAIRLTRVDKALRQDGEARAPIKPSVNGVWSALLGSDIRWLGSRALLVLAVAVTELLVSWFGSE